MSRKLARARSDSEVTPVTGSPRTRTPATNTSTALQTSDLRSLSQPSAWHSIRETSIRWLVILASFWAVGSFGDAPVVIAALVAIGWAQHGLALLGHDGAHRLLARGRRLNELIGGWLCWGPLGVPIEAYRRFHFAHHRLVGTDEDPERRALPGWPYRTRGGLWIPWIASLSSLMGSALHEFVLFAKCIPSRSAREAAPVLCTVGLATVLLLAMGAWWVPALWFGSSATAFFVFSRIRTFTEHVGADHTHRVQVPSWMAWVTHPLHADHHWEHHQWPSVPSFNLPQVRRMVGGTDLASLTETLNAERSSSPQQAD